MKGEIATSDSNHRRRGLKPTAAIIGLAGLMALVAPAAADAAKPWQGHWHGSGQNPATGYGRFKVDFDVTKRKKVGGVEVRNYVTGCYEQQSRAYFPLTEIDQTDRLQLVTTRSGREVWRFRVKQTFDDGFGSDYTVRVEGHINKAWTRVGYASEVDFYGPSLGDLCVPGADWEGSHA
jgi:opacity protein-like surface antigen